VVHIAVTDSSLEVKFMLKNKITSTICGLLLKMKRVRDLLVTLVLVEAAVFRYLVFQECEFSIVIRSTAYYIPLLTFQQ